MFETAQDAEDAFYDAIEAGDLEALMAVWDDAEDIACLLPMQPLQLGRAAVRAAWQPLFAQPQRLDLEVHHRQWTDGPDWALHWVEERPRLLAPGQPPMVVYASNLYRKTAGGWRLIAHQNSPTPPPRPAPA